jgi:hypothetical protein
MASEFDKPNGISIVHEDDLQARIWPLAVRKINGIGPKAEAKLHRLHVFTIGELAAQDPEWLRTTSAVPPAPGCTRWPGAATTGRWSPKASRCP